MKDLLVNNNVYFYFLELFLLVGFRFLPKIKFIFRPEISSNVYLIQKVIFISKVFSILGKTEKAITKNDKGKNVS